MNPQTDPSGDSEYRMSLRSSAPLAVVTGAAVAFYILDPDGIPIEIRQPVEV